jgi:hypothetical protein
VEEKMMEKKGTERWRISQAWGSFSYYDEPRSYYDPERKDVVMLDPTTKKNTKRHYTKKAK